MPISARAPVSESLPLLHLSLHNSPASLPPSFSLFLSSSRSLLSLLSLYFSFSLSPPLPLSLFLSEPGAARTILLFHIISARPSKQPRMVGSTLGVYKEQIKDIIISLCLSLSLSLSLLFPSFPSTEV